jgi:diacylglycerol kinase
MSKAVLTVFGCIQSDKSITLHYKVLCIMIEKCRHAIDGICYFLRREQSGKIQAIVTVITVVVAAAIGVTAKEFITIISTCLLVLLCEMFNTCVEHLCNIFSAAYDLRIKYIKDMAAGAVVLSCCIALLYGIYLFTFYIPLLIK